MRRTSGWGNYPVIHGLVKKPATIEEAKLLVINGAHMIPRGMGRSYGDAALHQVMVSTSLFNKIINIDEGTGTITCEAGVTIGQILQNIVTREFFLPVVPGTKCVSIGGAIAADIHGKNHHRDGSFSNFVESFKLLLANGELMVCSRSENAQIFWNTFGAMGLTGLISEATLKLMRIESAYMTTESIRTDNLEETIRLSEASLGHKYTVAWIDTTAQGTQRGRAILSRGNHASVKSLPKDKQLSLFSMHSNPTFNLRFRPPSVVTPRTIKLFNRIYYHGHAKRKSHVMHYNTFFFPLDRMGNWNKLYGRRGFVQFQAVLPLSCAHEALVAILSSIHTHREPSALAVLKRFGKGNYQSPLSFPIEGYALAMDFRRTTKTATLLRTLDKITDRFGGRIYLAKDAAMSPETFQNLYPALPAFKEFLFQVNPTHQFQSMQSSRLGITSPHD